MLASPRLRTSLLVLVSLLALAGCIGKDGQIEASSIDLAYEGSQSGSHESTGDCDSEGTLTGQGTVTDGRVRIRVLDGSGDARFDQTYAQDFTLSTQNIAGASGTWRITGERMGDDLVGDQFQGRYTVTQRC